MTSLKTASNINLSTKDVDVMEQVASSQRTGPDIQLSVSQHNNTDENITSTSVNIVSEHQRGGQTFL